MDNNNNCNGFLEDGGCDDDCSGCKASEVPTLTPETIKELHLDAFFDAIDSGYINGGSYSL